MHRDIELVVEFLQTRHDPPALATAPRLEAWLTARGLLRADEHVADPDVRRVAHLRAAMSDVISRGDARGDGRTDPTIAAVTKAAPLEVVPDGSRGLTLSASGTGVDRAMAELVAAMYRSGVRGELERLRTCRGCGLAFLDLTKNRSRVWCEMATCGSQHKAKSYRMRKAAAEER